MDSRQRSDRDEVARLKALRYAAGTMHHIRYNTLDWDHTDFTEVWFQQQAITYPSHLGKPPILIDLSAQRYLESIVAAEPPDPILGEIVVLGEEVAQPDWNPSRPGRVTIVRCDPVDGTSALAHSDDGYASVVTIESRRDSGQPWKHLAGAIVRNDGNVISWSRRAVMAHHVLLDIRVAPTPEAELVITNVGDGPLPRIDSRDIDEVHRKKLTMSGGAVAAQSANRRLNLIHRFSDVLGSAEYFDFKAGNPSAWQLCKGLMGWVIEPNWTTIHDSIYLWPFSYLGGHVVDHNHEPLDVLGLIEEHAGPDALAKAVPPYIGYVYEDSLAYLSGRLRDSAKPAE
jgi:hypothetical protein